MKTIGMIGGMSWESTLEYYRLVNEGVKEHLGRLHSAKCVLVSVDFAEIEVLQREGRWDEATQAMIDVARQVEAGGADFLLICTNTMHKMAEQVQASVNIPLLHIADATAEAVKTCGLRKIGLLGTRFTMEENFYRGRLADKFDLEVLIPGEADRAIVHRVIYEELVLGNIVPASKAEYKRIIESLIQQGAEGIILGCTEIGLLIQDADSRVPLFDTTRIHASAAVKMALSDETGAPTAPKLVGMGPRKVSTKGELLDLIFDLLDENDAIPWDHDTAYQYLQGLGEWLDQHEINQPDWQALADALLAARGNDQP